MIAAQDNTTNTPMKNNRNYSHALNYRLKTQVEDKEHRKENKLTYRK